MVTGCPVPSLPCPAAVPCPAQRCSAPAVPAMPCPAVLEPALVPGCPMPAALPGDAVQIPAFALRSDARFRAESLHHTFAGNSGDTALCFSILGFLFTSFSRSLPLPLLPSSLLQSYLAFFLVLEIIGFWKSKSQALQIPPSQEN